MGNTYFKFGKCPSGFFLIPKIIPPDLRGLCFRANEPNSSVNANLLNVNLEYRTEIDGVSSDWSEYPLNTVIQLPNVGDKLFLRNVDSQPGITVSDLDHTFVMTGSISASGSIMYLLDKNAIAVNMGVNCFYSLFNLCSSLVTPPDLPATTLSVGCYMNMFGHSGITKMPELPATTLPADSYKGMISNCVNLTKPIKRLPATVLGEGCYNNMFVGCSSLEFPPIIDFKGAIPNATFVYMFNNCSSLNISEEPIGTAFFTCPVDTQPIATLMMFSGVPGIDTQYGIANPGSTYYFQ